MARIRSIKPEFWDDYRLAMDLTRDERLFYIGLWNQADDEGRFKAHPGRLLRAIFPYDEDLHVSFSEHALNRLTETGRLVLYVVDSEPYGQLTKFRDHQKPNRPQPSKIPSPTTDIVVVTADSLNAQCARTAVVVGEQVGEQVVERTAPLCVAEFDQFWSLYPKRAGSNPKANAIRAWNARIRQGVSPADLVNGLRRYVQYCETSELIGSQYVLQAATFLGSSRRWEEAWKPPSNGRKSDQRRRIDDYEYTPTEEVPQWPK